MKIIRAEHLGMCFGVRDAIALAIRKSQAGPLTVLGDLVHNETVLAGLRARGVRIAQDAGAVETREVMITAHGASEKAIERARARGLKVTEATCPLVRVAHQALAGLVLEGYHPVIVGLRDHVEVRGMTEDLEEYDVILWAKDVQAVRERPRFGVVAQTTQPIRKVLWLTELLRRRFPGSEVRLVDTVCRPTRQRQQAAVEMACQADVVVVIGGAHSNNTKELVATCGRYCPRVHHVQTSRELRPEWFEGAEVVGLTAGTSTPDASVSEVERWLLDFAAVADDRPWTAAGRERAAA
jgi:4-hydroxy-3-methylbut-2-enyl diphosphate reductase